ncbi:chemotaxis protein [Rhodospirillum rubrum]|nr:chemotaxis protein [Rhodospirillum rubrum]MBK1677449.1 chemotaxis protein [Rhodospirillum rubrum]
MPLPFQAISDKIMILDRLPVSRKLFALVLVSLLGIGTTAILALSQVHDVMMDDRRAKVRAIVDLAFSQTADLADRAARGAISAEAAKAQAIEILRRARYDEGEYLFIIDTKGRSVMHPLAPEMEGKDMSEVKDAKGTAMFAEMARLAVSQGSGFVSYEWQRGAQETASPKISYVRRLSQWDWVIGSGIYIDDVEAAFTRQALIFVAVVGAVVAVLLALSLIIGRGIAGPLVAMTARMRRMAAGDLETAIPGEATADQRRDEVGDMAAALVVFRENLRDAKRLAEEHRHEEEQKHIRRQQVDEQIRAFEMTVVRLLDGLVSADQSVRSTTTRLVDGARDTMSEANEVAASAEHASANVETVASAAEELSASIQEIARQVEQSSGVARRAVEETGEATKGIAELEERVGQITDIVKLISDIASQTNLLALNATIEAARAGDAGKGFAVVAGEVKNLANQTQKATKDITGRIADVEGATARSVRAIRDVSKVIGEIHEISASISAAVEEQGAATREIARNVDEAATGTNRVSSAIGRVRAAAEEANSEAGDMERASRDLGHQAEVLKGEVAEFLQGIRLGDGEDHALVTWSDDLATGDAHVDEDHRQLMTLVNSVYGHVKQGEAGAALEASFGELKRYSIEHFAEEEAFMAKAGFPQAETHRRQHQHFLERSEALFETYRQGADTAAVELMGLLGSWWETHIRIYDTELAHFVRRQQGVPTLRRGA